MQKKIEKAEMHSGRKSPMRQNRSSRRSLRHGYLAVEGQEGGFPCMIKNLNDDGATISLTGLMGIPENFSLFVEPESVRYTCEVSATKGNSINVNFVEKQENIRFRDYLKRNAA